MSYEQSVATAVMNRAFEADPVAVESLMRVQVLCNKAMADNPALGTSFAPDHAVGYLVSVLGLLNGVLAAKGDALVAAEFHTGTGRLVGFCDYREPAKAAT